MPRRKCESKPEDESKMQRELRLSYDRGFMDGMAAGVEIYKNQDQFLWKVKPDGKKQRNQGL